MRVAFCGAGGTGKTTTMAALLNLTTLETVPSISRQVYAANKIAMEQDFDLLTPPMKILIQDQIREGQWETFRTRDNIVSDRSPADHFAYYLNYCGDFIDYGTLCRVRSLTKKRLETFHYVFYFPLMTFPGQDDGMRKVMEGYRYRYDLILRGVLKDMEINYHTLRRAGTAEQRAVRILDVIAEKDLSIIKKL
jgi:predicted ATPase